MTPITQNFYWENARCGCGCLMPKDVQTEVRLTARWAEGIREALGGQPFRILYWYRCESYNALIGGDPNSQHLFGKAIDFVIKTQAPRWTQTAIVVEQLYPSPIRGFGKYAGYSHIDRRAGDARTWEE